MITVKNANGTSRFLRPSTGEGTWIAYWENQMGNRLDSSRTYSCPACNGTTQKSNFVGAHVLKNASTDQHLYIVPLCKACNQRTDSFTVAKNLLCPVPSNL